MRDDDGLRPVEALRMARNVASGVYQTNDQGRQSCVNVLEDVIGGEIDGETVHLRYRLEAVKSYLLMDSMNMAQQKMQIDIQIRGEEKEVGGERIVLLLPSNNTESERDE